MTSCRCGGAGLHSSIHKERTLVRSARYSETSCLMSYPNFARMTACVWAAVSLMGAAASPFDLAACSSRDWGTERSSATASRICYAGLRSWNGFMDEAAGRGVAANASHFARMVSMSRTMKSASRTFSSRKDGALCVVAYFTCRIFLTK